MSWKCICGKVMASLAILKCVECGGRKEDGQSLVILKGDWM